MDAAGLNQLCELCGARLNRVKHHRPHGVGRACREHQGYSKAVLSSAAAPAVPPSGPVRSHKRARSDPGQLPPLPLLHIAPPPLPLPFQPTWHSHGWSLHPFSRNRRATAVSWLDLAKNDELKQWELKRGEYWQHSTETSLVCSFLDEKRVRLRHSSERIARALLSDIGVDATSLRLAAIKIVRASCGQGQQEIHYDIPQYARAVQCFTVLMYLTPTLSTAVPVLPLKDIRCCFTEGENRPSAAALKFLTRDKFTSVRVSPGDMMAFNCAVPHYGVANPDPHDRYVLFLLFSPASSPTPDSEEQRYPHGVVD
jgi:hypothetical protein